MLKTLIKQGGVLITKILVVLRHKFLVILLPVYLIRNHTTVVGVSSFTVERPINGKSDSLLTVYHSRTNRDVFVSPLFVL